MRLTDERIDEILRPKDIIGQTELESLAREVRELREDLSKTRDLWCELLNATGQYDHANALDWIRKLTCERDDANIIREKLTAENKRLLLRLRDADTAAIERDEARELLRRFRFNEPTHTQCCRDYDARFGQSQPEPSGEFVPWDAETRPKGPVTLRRRDRHWYEFTPAWEMDGDASGEYLISWKELCVEYEWSPRRQDLGTLRGAEMSDEEYPEVWCQKCGVSSRDRAMKYCGSGNDKDNEHIWKPTKPEKTRYKPVLLSELNRQVATERIVDDAYRRGFEAAKAAALEIVSDEAARYGTGSMAMGVRYVGHKIEQLKPETTQ